jgi:hypothetical protein
MGSSLPDDSVVSPTVTTGGLDEFTCEDSTASATAEPAADPVVRLDCEPPAAAAAGPLLEPAPATPSRTQVPAFLSRVESLQARRRKRRASRLRRYANGATAVQRHISEGTRAITNAVHRGSRASATKSGQAIGRAASIASERTRAAGRVSRQVASRGAAGARTMMTLSARAWSVSTASAPRLVTARISGTALHDQEADGLAIAVVLAIVVVSYGSLLVVTWRQPADHRVPDATAIEAPHAAATPAARTLVAMPVNESRLMELPGVTPAPPHEAVSVAPRRVAFIPSEKMLTAMWQQRDTRSLERAFTTLRGQTLAFHRCGMRVTDSNRAVARCQGVATIVAADGTQFARPATWTLMFRRAAGRWVIADVAMR